MASYLKMHLPLQIVQCRADHAAWGPALPAFHSHLSRSSPGYCSHSLSTHFSSFSLGNGEKDYVSEYL